MRIAVCDDDRSVLEAFQGMLSDGSVQSKVEPFFFCSAGELMDAAAKKPFDLVFSDIMLGEEDGIKTAARICARHPRTKVVFITSHVLEYAEEIFSAIQPYGYIGKPVYPPKVYYYIHRLDEEMASDERTLAISIHGAEYNLKMADIRYLESEKRQVHIHCSGKTISIYEKLDEVERRLDSRFVRCHQSFAVNLDWVLRLENGTLVLRGEEKPESVCISISRNRLENTRRRYFEHKGRSVM